MFNQMTTTTKPSSRERILEAARELFWVNGYRATSVAEILEKAGVNSGSLYHYFEGKEELLLAVLGTYKDMLYSAVIEPAFQVADDPIERIFAVLEGYRRGLLYTVFTGGCPIGNLALEVGDHHPEARQRIAENFDGWVGWMRKCLDDAAGRLPAQLDRPQLALFILTVMEGAVMQSRAHASIAPFDSAVTQLRDYFHRLLAEDTRENPGGEHAAQTS
jgi:AcrR family transcriptional regulator